MSDADEKQNPFHRHGIYHLSASSLALYRAEPTLWTMQYLFRIRGEVGGAAWRVKAVEAALDMMLFGEVDITQATEAATRLFDLQSGGEINDKFDKERAAIAGFITQAWELLRPLGKPAARQQKVSLWLESDFEGTQIEVPIIGYYDYMWDLPAIQSETAPTCVVPKDPSFIVDLKSTWACPSSPKTDHAIQVTTYHLATGRVPKLAYVTPKKSAIYEISQSEIDEWKWALTRSAFALRQVLARSRNRNEVLSLFSPDFDNFRWDERLKEELHKIYAGGPTRPKFAGPSISAGQ